MEEIIITLKIIISIIAVVISLLALWATIYNIRLQNKQRLFDKRLSSYEFIMSLKRLIDENHDDVLKKYTDINLDNDYNFQHLTNNSSLSKIQAIMEDPQDNIAKNNFLTMLETFDEEAMKQKFIFQKGYADIFSDFISSYKGVLHNMYLYQIKIKKGEEINKRHISSGNILALEEIHKLTNENKSRDTLNISIDKLEIAYSKLENLPSKRIEKQIRLFNPLVSGIVYSFFQISNIIKLRTSKIKNKIKKLSSQK